MPAAAFKQNAASLPIKVSAVAFKGLHNVKVSNVRKINIEAEKAKLLRVFEDLLQTESTQEGFIESLISNLSRSLNALRRKAERKKAIVEELEKLVNDRTMTNQEKLNRSNQLKKEWAILEKKKVSQKPAAAPKQKDERIDYKLINKFKSAISEDNFDLHKVFDEYYSKLKEITSVDELKEIFPNIKIPQRPEKVIAKKIESVLTRDFFKKFDELCGHGSKDEIFQHSDKKIKEILEATFKGSGIDWRPLYQHVAIETHKTIAAKFLQLKQTGTFSAIPEIRKKNVADLNISDIKMLSVDFDDFVLSTLRKHYLEGKKFNEISYPINGTDLTLSSLQQNEYKFEKMSEKIKAMMNSSKTLHDAQRNYESFDVNELRARLAVFAGKESGSSEELLEKIIAFDTCKFTPEDKECLIKFLKEMDNVNDGKKTCQQAIETIRKEGISPKETERLNEIEKKKAAEKLKLHQQRAFELNSLKSRFDDLIDVLYMNNMNNVANICAKYRPESLDVKAIEKAEFVMEIIQKNIKPDKGSIVNSEKLESSIFRWETFNHYKAKRETNPLYQKALSFAKEGDAQSKTDTIDRAGKYLINSEIVENFPESLEFAKNSELLTKIMEKSGTDKDSAVRYLCKLDDYLDLDENERNYISKFIELFNTKDVGEKTIFKHIIENDYVNAETKVLTGLSENLAEPIVASISPKAKRAILDKYKFPLCVGYMRDFEEALSSFATKRGSSGIKKIDGNNKSIEYAMELKLKNHDDRLFSSGNDFCFDIFSEKGLH